MTYRLTPKMAALASHIKGDSFEDARAALKTDIEKREFDKLTAKAVAKIAKVLPNSQPQTQYRQALNYAKAKMALFQLKFGFVRKRK